MIQRIQSIWLLLAALFNSGLFFFDLYRADAPGIRGFKELRVVNHFPSLLIALVITILPLVAIFMFANRKRQRLMTMFGLLATLGFISFTLMRVGYEFNNETSAPINGTYWIGSILPVVSVVFFILAIRGIRNDEKLVKSIDRLR